MKAASSPMFIRWELLYDGFVIDFISICETIHASTVAFFILFFPFYNLNLKLQNCNTEAYLKKGSKNFGRKIATKIQRFPWFYPYARIQIWIWRIYKLWSTWQWFGKQFLKNSF